MWDPYAEFQMETLPNGLTMYVAYWPDRQWETMGFLVHTGAEHDPVGLEGLSHFVEHLVSENAGISKEKIKSFFEKNGGNIDFGTTRHSDTRYRCFVPKDENIIAKALNIIGNMLLSAKIQKFIERERKVIIGEFHEYFPTDVAKERYLRERKALYSGYWLERSLRCLGTIESIREITQEDLQLHYDKHYTPSNISIVCVGGKTLSELLDIISRSSFATKKEGVRTLLPIPVTYVDAPLETKYVFELSKHMTMSTLRKVGGYQSVAKIPGNISIFATKIMDKMISEILNKEIRERRSWTYGIHSSYYDLRYFQEFSIDCDALALEALDEIEEVVEECITSLLDQERLFEKAKKSVLAANFMIDVNGKEVCDDALDDLANKQRIISLVEYGTEIEKITMSDIYDLIRWLRPQQRWTCITKP